MCVVAVSGSQAVLGELYVESFNFLLEASVSGVNQVA